MGKRGKHHGKRTDSGFASQGAARGGRGRLAGKMRTEPAGRRRTTVPRGVSPNRRHGFAGGTRPYDYSAYESEPATPEYLARLFVRHSFPVTARQLERFWRYYELLRRKNASLDLTRIMGIEATTLKHFIDSAIILRWFEPEGPVLDIGSGPGFPGLPLAIMREDCQFILAESREKRIGFLREAIAGLELRNVRLFPRTVREDSPLGDEHGLPLGDVVTRALEAITPTLGRILPFIKPGRQAVFLKGPDCDAEISDALSSFPGIFDLTGDANYRLPGTDQKRRLPRFRKLPFPPTARKSRVSVDF
ncbi:MAG: 16S rRNA (guanine(527)-N(7))-methyltransferase RsmG [Planctomycetota bacterium]|jgi:16S rRNA (guanine527-N7)-methyltransferase|nr:16S rRNA (guanine(527)-N(7))-methyltransferase RsmG [Planctomycetota bacterium]